MSNNVLALLPLALAYIMFTLGAGFNNESAISHCLRYYAD